MNDDLMLSEYGEQCIKLWEEGTLTPKLRAYDDGGGTWTISWGCIEGVYKGMVITPEEAEAMFQKEIAKHVGFVKKYVKTDLTQCQFDAAVSFFFNEGAAQGYVRAINAVNFEETVPETLMKYVYVHGNRWPGLVRRRSDELKLWNGVYEDARITVPSPYAVANAKDIYPADEGEKPIATIADLAPLSRKVSLLVQARNWMTGLGVGGTSLGFADLQSGADTVHKLTPVLKENSLFIIAAMAIAGLVAASALIAWILEDHADGRYQPSKGA